LPEQGDDGEIGASGAVGEAMGREVGDAALAKAAVELIDQA
jgi:hypothetical protein